MNGYAGKILRLDLTNRSATLIDTSKYASWFGGRGMGTALFWDEVDKAYITDPQNKSGFEPDNVLCIMSGPLQGTLTPIAGRCEVLGMAPECYPYPQLLRANSGGRLSSMMKFAGYDGIVVKGAADSPVWVNIMDDQVTFEDASGLWGLDTWEAQLEIWKQVAGQAGYGRWLTAGNGYSTQRSAIILCGQAGENLSRQGCLMTDAGRSWGQGGFGGVFGSKKLKAISVLGTGSVPVADPDELYAARIWSYQSHPVSGASAKYQPWGNAHAGRPLGGCLACGRACNSNYETDQSFEMAGTESHCVGSYWNSNQSFDRAFFIRDILGTPKGPEEELWPGYDYWDNKPKYDLKVDSALANSWINRYGINSYDMGTGGLGWLLSLYQRGYLGKGKRINSDLDFSKFGSAGFANEILRRVAYREEIGDDLAEGNVRAAAKWGVLEEDLMNGVLPSIYWCGESHWGVQVDWAYESLFDTRDVNMHTLSSILNPSSTRSPEVRAKEFARMAAPWHDISGVDRSENGLYSLGMARCVAWHRRECLFYCDSANYCEQQSPQLFLEGDSPTSHELENRFIKAVTGIDKSYEEWLEQGRKVWNFQRAIEVLHGRHRDAEYFPPFPPYNSYVYTDVEPYLQNNKYGGHPAKSILAYVNGEWVDSVEGRHIALKKDRMDDFKSIYYDLEGWDTNTGWPTRSTLEGCGLKYVADELEARGKMLT